MASHQELGEQLNLFMTHPYTPGSVFLLPNGTIVYKALENYLRSEYKKRGYQEVITPQLASVKLWKQSGHWSHYKENMFHTKIKNNDLNENMEHNNANNDVNNDEDSDMYSNKPMNCPLHCLMFKRGVVSYRSLPIRFADFGVLHRNESTGALRGMTRLRKFCQDDAHIFCRDDQILNEIKSCLEFLKDIYKLFGFNYKIAISTRPDKYMGDLELWIDAEKALKCALNELNLEYTIKEKDGAFYGPKIDVMVKDSLSREHQCGTIQLDFQLPNNFDLTYIDTDTQKARPVIIHRAILGSIERMMAVLIEHFQGKFPMWMSPKQIAIVPIASKPEFIEYCKKMRSDLMQYDSRIEYVDVFDSSDTFNSRIREAEILLYNYVLVVGKIEMTKDEMRFRIKNHKRNDESVNKNDGFKIISESYFSNDYIF